jgi:hypothetical protein
MKNQPFFCKLQTMRGVIWLLMLSAVGLCKAQVLEPLGNGLPSKVVAAYAVGQDYLALFSEESTPDTSDYVVARWNGAYWSYYPGLYKPEAVKTVDGQYNFNSLVLYRDTMYVGAYISNAKRDADVAVSHLYKWNGERWITDNSVVKSKNDGIVAMTVFDNKLVVAGKFLDALNGTLVNNIATYDGQTGQWGFLGSSNTTQGSDGAINALQAMGNRLYIAGDFQNFAGTFTGNIAYYTASNNTWGGIGSPFKQRVDQLAVYNSKLAALGYNAGILELREFSGNWTPAINLDTMDRAIVRTIAGSGNSLFIGGDFLRNGNGSSVLRFENDRLSLTGNRISGAFYLGQRGSEAFIWGNFTEQNTGLKRICKIENYSGNIAGTIFFDKNQNCIQDAGDVPLPMTMVRFTSMKTGKIWFASSDAKGKFAAALPQDDYNMQVFAGRHWQNSCQGNTASSVKNGEYSMVSLGQYIAPNINDIEIQTGMLVPGSIRPGDEIQAVISIKNTGSALVNGPTLHLSHDPRLLQFKADSIPDNYSNSEAIWSITNFEPGAVKTFLVSWIMPLSAKQDDVFPVRVKSGSAFVLNDAYQSDNFDTLDLKLMDNGSGAVSKTSLKGDDVDYRVRELTYHVNFTNTGKSLVKRLVMLDTVDVNLPLSRVVITNLYPTDAVVRTEKGNILVVEFPNANLAALESNASLASGFITYRIELTNDLKAGQYVYNRANGDFDSKWKASSNMVVVQALNPSASLPAVRASFGSLWPNPAGKTLSVALNTECNGEIAIYGLTGICLYKKSLSGNSITLDVADLPNGIYCLKTPLGQALFQVMN